MVHKYVCFIVILEKQGGHGPQGEADGAQDHLSYHGRSTLETGVTVDKDAISESKNDTDQEDQQAPKHIWTSRHQAGCITSQGTGPGHFGGIKHRTDEGEGSGSDGLVPGGTLEQELNIVYGENNEAAKGKIEGIVVENIIAGQGEVGLEPTQVHYEDSGGSHRSRSTTGSQTS